MFFKVKYACNTKYFEKIERKRKSEQIPYVTAHTQLLLKSQHMLNTFSEVISHAVLAIDLSTVNIETFTGPLL